MANECPNCKEQMGLISTDPPTFHCGQCGTAAARSVQDADGDFKYVYTPELVSLCKALSSSVGELDDEQIKEGAEEIANMFGVFIST